MSSDQTNNDPWSQTTTQASDDPWGQASDTSASADWLNSEAVEVKAFDPLNPFEEAVLPVDVWVESGLN